MINRTLFIAAATVILTITSQAQPLFYKDGAYMGTEFGLYSKQRLSGTSDTKKYPGLYGGWMFGLNPVSGLLSGIVGGDDPFLTIGSVQIADALTVRADFGAWVAPFNIMLGYTGEYAVSMKIGAEEDDLAFVIGPRVQGSGPGPGESTAVIGVGYYGASLKYSKNIVDVTFPFSKAKDEATWLILHYHNVKNDADLGANTAGSSFMLGIAYQW